MCIRDRFWVAKTVWQRIPSQLARHRKAPTTKTVQSIARYDQLPLSGRTQMLTASDFCCDWGATVESVVGLVFSVAASDTAKVT